MMNWYFLIVPILLVVGFAAWRGVRQVSPRAVLMAALPALLVFLVLQFVTLPDVSSAKSGEDAVDLSGTLFTVAGKRATLANYPGRVVFLNFWATWCAPCRKEMPSMQKLYRELSDEGLAMVAITDEDPDTVRKFLEVTGTYSFPILLDTDGTLFRRLNVQALPMTLVLDKDKKVVLEHFGGYDWADPEIVEKFRALLAE